jgi:hypothetical protein
MSIKFSETEYAVCLDCVMSAAGYDAHELGCEPEHEPLSKFAGDTTTTIIPTYTDLGFSNKGCQGCEDKLAGNRYAITLLDI